MVAPVCLLGIDWGTSNRRAYVIGADGACLRKHEDAQGALAAQGHFAEALQSLRQQLDLDALHSVIAAGMVGSAQGWKEAPYVNAPASAEALVDGIVRVQTARGVTLHIVPGVLQNGELPNVMRGEETQIVGLGPQNGRRMVCLPGTHSKWIAVEGDTIGGFATFITGDLFAAAGKHTILSHSVDGEVGRFDAGSFAAGFRAALERPGEITNHMFAIRARGLLDPANPIDGGSALSGLLIGLEFAGVESRFGRLDRPILLAAGRLGEIYEEAFAQAGVTCDIADADAAVRRGLLAAAREILT